MTVRRRGTTLIELIVVLALVALMMTLVPIATFGRGTVSDPIVAQRAEAIRSGHRIVIRDSAGPIVLLLPDGRVVGGGRDPLTGMAIDATR